MTSSIHFIRQPISRFNARSAQAGGVLLTVIVLIIASTLVCASVLNNALTALRLAQRNDVRAQMTAVADSELDWMYFNVKNAVSAATPMPLLGDSIHLRNQADHGTTPTTIRLAYLDSHRQEGWRVQRSVRHLLNTTGVDTANGGSRRAMLDYIEVKIILLPPETGLYKNLTPIRIGRYFVATQSTIFQYGVFFDGDLELNPGEDYELNGDIYASGNAFLGAFDGKSITIHENAKLRLVAGKNLNGSGSPDFAGTTLYNPAFPGGGGALTDPIFKLTGTATPGAQRESLTKEENLLGGMDVLTTAKNNPELFGPHNNNIDPNTWTPAEVQEAMNNVKRALITPPPSAAGPHEYANNPGAGTEDPTIAVQRAYNRAGLVLTVDESSGMVTVHSRATDGSLIDVTSTYQDVAPIASKTPLSVHDSRENKNIQITELNVQALAQKLEDVSGFNGLLYVNLKNSSSENPAAVRIINGENVPVTASGTGLSVATNAGLYIKGSYNTTPSGTDASGKPIYPSSMLMADAITVLSYAWDDAKAAFPSWVADPNANQRNEASTGTGSSIDINAGLLTGNTPTSISSASGGAQNLIRFLENWDGIHVNFYGSLGRLFDSKHFGGRFRGVGDDYWPPLRKVTYDANLASTPPAGAPILPGFSKGDIFRF